MNRLHLTSCLAAAIVASSSALALAQTSSSGMRSTSGGSTTTTGRSTSVIRPATQSNSQVPPSAVGLPGGATNVPLTVGSGIGTAVPIYGTQDASSTTIAGSIDASEERSSATDCTGTGTRSSTGSGSTSATTSNCSSSSGSSLGTSSIMGSSGSIDVSGN